MDIENTTSPTKLITKLFNLLELFLTSQGPDGWTDLEGPHMIIDVHLPSEKVKEVIEQNTSFISTVCSSTQGEIESIFFGGLITKGLSQILESKNLQTKFEIAAEAKKEFLSLIE
jgi:hypothetical protein